MKLKTIAGLIGIVTLINISTRLIGFLREIIIGVHFGTSSMADNVVLAYTIPNFLYLVLGGAITTSFISIYNKINEEKNKIQFKNVIFTYSTIAVLVITTLLLIANTTLINSMFPGVEGQQKDILEKLFLITAPSTYFLVLSMWYSGVLNIQGKYIGASFSTLTNNLIFVLFVIIAFPNLGVYAYGWGSLLGSIVMFLLMSYELKKGKFLSYSFTFKYDKTSDIKRMMKILFPIALGGATLQFYFIVQRFFGSYLAEGYIAALNYASKLVQLPQVILMTSVTTVIYPLLAKKVANGEFKVVKDIFKKGDHLLFLYLVPLSVFIYFYSYDIISFIFEYGSFNRESTVMTAAMLKIFVIGMHAHSANMYITRFYYAMEKALFPVFIGLFSVFGLNTVITLSLMDHLGADAVAWGTTISAYFQYFALLIVGKKKLGLDINFGRNQVNYFIIIFSQILIMSLASTYITFAMPIVNIIIGLILFGLSFGVTVFLLGYHKELLGKEKKSKSKS
ncbi:murein biosynthesis integral membrane protein MurJ [Mesobacillus sp. AQ2]|uniref:murein biosynthesis integral membrane protein MurJ n=1 Tax=Mesobacillus sp. AQ2 TaxID=3043332 RepID=UPI0024C13D59|nr:murein biosynthesis integral membrane protein MurJ [Mesobacillus sp. AQ2]WHX40259.1 murein biosynthesis integral membrane protein MurJ [Mesobacillus sp. AQ2]